MRPEERAKVRYLLMEKPRPKCSLPPSNLKKIPSSIELPFIVADVPHPGQVWETAGVTLDAGITEEEDEIPNWLDCVTLVVKYPTG